MRTRQIARALRAHAALFDRWASRLRQAEDDFRSKREACGGDPVTEEAASDEFRKLARLAVEDAQYLESISAENYTHGRQ